MIFRSRVNREVQTVNWDAGKEGAAETGVRRGLKMAHNYRELEAKKAQKPRIGEGRLPWSANREFVIFGLQKSNVSVHNVHFMVYAPLSFVSNLFVCFRFWGGCFCFMGHTLWFFVRQMMQEMSAELWLPEPEARTAGTISKGPISEPEV